MPLDIVVKPFINVFGCVLKLLLYKSMVRPHLQYANSVWFPHKQADIKELEKIQKELPNW